MPVFSVFRSFLFPAACLALAACSSLDNASGRVAGLLTPYKAEVVQGNFVSKEQKEALQIGMQRAQVQDILGSPLVTSVFHADRWEYVFTIRRQGTEPQQRKLTVYFKGDELAKVDSDELISEEEFVGSLSKGRSLGKVPVLELPADKLPTPPAARANSSDSSNASAPPRVYPPLEPAR
jgi:outer membrane protein assembly factor BamE